jgi:hypothetical protein
MKKMMLYLGILIFLVGLGCHKDKLIPPFDPCTSGGLHVASARFMVAEEPPFQFPTWKLFDTDTVASRELTLTADETNATCVWEFGGNTVQSNSVGVKLPANSSGSTFTFKLTVKKDWSKTCFTQYDTSTVMTIRKIVYLEDSSLIEHSSFRGYCLDKPNDIFVMTFDRRIDLSTGQTQPLIFVTNMLRGITGYAPERYTSYRQSYISSRDFGLTGLNQGSGLAILSKNDSIRYDFNYLDNPGPTQVRLYKTFVGKKIL